MRKTSGSFAALLASTSMTPAERAKGRFMRAPDEHPAGSAEAQFAEFERAGEIEVGATNAAPDAEEPAKPAKRRGPPKEAKPAEVADEGDKKPAKPAKQGDEDEEPEDEEGDEDEEKPAKKRVPPSERIRELNKRLRTSERLRVSMEERLERLEKGDLPDNSGGANSVDEIGEAPDPTDTKAYPLGHLDDRYIEDKLEWLATKKAAELADAALQRQQGNEQARQAEQARTELLEKVDDLATRGSELFEDFQEAVVDAGMRGEWQLSQATFEAAYEAENGAQILYDLSQDKKEAARVNKLSSYQQMKYVMEKDAEISAKTKPRKIPGAGAPPNTQTRGANSRTAINPATDNLEDFEKAWVQDEKRGNRH